MIQALPDELAELLDDASPASDAASDAVVDAFMAEHTRAGMPQVFHGWRKALQKHFETGSRHDGTVKVTVGALKEAAARLLPGASRTRRAARVVPHRGHPPANRRRDTNAARKKPKTNSRGSSPGLSRRHSPPTSSRSVPALNKKCPTTPTLGTPTRIWRRLMEHQSEGGDTAEVNPPPRRRRRARRSITPARSAWPTDWTRYADKLLHVNGIGWHHWNGKLLRPSMIAAQRNAPYSPY